MSEQTHRSKHTIPPQDLVDGVGAPSDPIARNPKDVDEPGEEVQTTEVRRRTGIVPLAPGASSLPGWAAGMARHGSSSSSALGLLVPLVRFKWTVLLIAVLISAPAWVAIWMLIVPKYQARAEVRVRPIVPRLVFRTEENGMIPLYDSFVNTQVSLIRGLTVLQRALDLPEVQKTRWYREPSQTLMERLRGNTAPHMERLRDGLSVRPRPRTEIIDVSFVDASATEAKLIVNAVLDRYVSYIGEASDATEDVLSRQLLEQHRSLQTDIEGREKVCAELRRQLGTETPQELVSSQRIRLDGAQARLKELRNRMALLDWEMKQSAPKDSNSVPTVPVAVAAEKLKYHADAEWRRLDVNVRAIQHQMETYGPTHPARARLTKEMEFSQELLRLREEQLDDQTQRPPVAGTVPTGSESGLVGIPLEYQMARAKYEEQLVQAELAKEEAEFRKLFDSAQLLDREMNALRAKRELYDAVRQRLDQKNMERGVPGSIEVLTEAFAPSKPTQDRRIVFTIMALAAGLGLGGAVAFLRASRDQTIHAVADMPQPLQLSLLGQLPLIQIRKPAGLLCDDVFQNQTVLGESVRTMRTALLSRLDQRGSTSVLITSATPGTGKSSFTMTLGKSMAQAGKRVLVIDADLHKRSLSEKFKLLDERGFLDSLKQRRIDAQHIFPTETPGLSVMPAGKVNGDTLVVEEFANGAFKICLDQLSNGAGYDLILVDSPPVLPVADAVILAGQVDGTIIVERERLSRRAQVADALTRLGSAGARILGMVFVGSTGPGGHKYGYGYEYSYGYGHGYGRNRKGKKES
ncbi:MAG: P-loop NTPase [Planctomycetes bacterium]|nr:P-loop NTPase [Planctomycetota bacterium]